MCRRKIDFSMAVRAHVLTFDKPVPGNNFLIFRIPGNQLVIGIGAGIVFVKVEFQPCTTASRTERQFPKSSYFPYRMRRVVMIYQVYFVVSVIGIPDKRLLSKLPFYEPAVNRCYDILHIVSFQGLSCKPIVLYVQPTPFHFWRCQNKYKKLVFLYIWSLFCFSAQTFHRRDKTFPGWPLSRSFP